MKHPGQEIAIRVHNSFIYCGLLVAQINKWSWDNNDFTLENPQLKLLGAPILGPMYQDLMVSYGPPRIHYFSYWE